MSTDLALIRRRRAEIEGEISHLQTRIQELQSDFRDLAIAERVVAKLTGDASETTRTTAEQPFARPSGGKPEGTPKVTEMIVSVLEDARQEGLRGLEPKDMAARIAQRWWPEVRPDDVNGIAWRMWKRNNLVKHESVYMLPKKEEAADANLAGGAPTASVTGDIFK